MENTYLEQVDNHVPLTTIADKVVSEEINQSVINRSVGILNREFEVIVGLVQLVPEEEVRLRDRVSGKAAR